LFSRHNQTIGSRLGNMDTAWFDTKQRSNVRRQV
jgi:hypothetical protein